MNIGAMNNSKVLCENLEFLESFDPNVARQVRAKSSQFSLECTGDRIQLLLGGELISPDLRRDTKTFSIKPAVGFRRISMVRIYRDKILQLSSEKVASLIDDADNPVILPELSAFSNQLNNLGGDRTSHDLLFLGSFNLIHLYDHIRSDPTVADGIASVTVVESSYSAFAVSLSLISLEDLAAITRSKNIKLHIICDHDSNALREKLFYYLAYLNPCSLHGLHVANAFYLDPTLLQIDGWLSSQSGIGYRFLATLGYTTDELNQLRNTVLNLNKASIQPSNKIKDLQILRELAKDRTPVIIGSGPSLDLNITVIKENRSDIFIIAAGSSLSTLLSAGVVPDALAVLERSTAVYEAIAELNKRYSLAQLGVALIASLTADSRIQDLFETVCFIQRPLSAASLLATSSRAQTLELAGPEVANLAIEVVIKIGFNVAVAIGCDFSSPTREEYRSNFALGDSPRLLNQPVLGTAKKTVYTDQMFILARDSIEHLLQNKKSFSLFRIGEGLVIQGAKQVHAEDLSEMVLKNLPVAASAINSLEANPTGKAQVTARDTEETVKTDAIRVLQKVSSFYDLLVNKISESSFWNRDLADIFAEYMNPHIGPDEVQSEDLLIAVGLKRALREVTFFIVQPLYDSLDEHTYAVNASKVVDSLQFVRDVVYIYLNKYMRP